MDSSRGDIVDLVRTSPTLRTHLSYSRFQGDTAKILLLNAQYHLVSEVTQALRTQGHEVALLDVIDDGPSMLRALLHGLVTHKPDFVLTINHLGFDASGRMGELLEFAEIPIAAWYVDSPLFVLRGSPIPAASVTTLFTWERSLVPLYQKQCETQYLPLATQPAAFLGHRQEADPTGVAFVGNSGLAAQRKWKSRLSPSLEAQVSQLSHQLARRSQDHFNDPKLLTETELADSMAAATWRANSKHRAEILRPFLNEADFHLYGDGGWPEVLAGSSPVQGPSYGPDLAEVYRRHAVQLNITSLQMPTAVNQRVFDAPAAGAFVLTDAQDDVRALFGEDELAVYSSSEEAIDKARFYAGRPHRRAELVARGQARVLSEHTYEKRVQTLVETLRRRFQSKRRHAS